MATFSFSFVKSKQKKSSSRAEYVSKIEKNVVGSVYINNEGDFIIKHTDTYYIPSKKSLELKGKNKLFVFDKRDKKGIIVYLLGEHNNTHFGFPFMALAPGHIVEGDIIEDINKNKFFDVKKVLLEFNSDARYEYITHRNELIDLYNERNKTS